MAKNSLISLWRPLSLSGLAAAALSLLGGCGSMPSGYDYSSEQSYGGTATSTSKRETSRRAPVEQRPGLGTEYGEHRGSRVSDANFVRSSASPARGSIYYNDREGIDNMIAGTKWHASRQRSFAVGSATVTIRGGGWRALPGYRVNGRNYIVGQEGSRYEIAVKNNSWRRIEIVLSVDGLDVIDGRPASSGKRGYVIGPRETMNIEGWRTSKHGVAAFRFGAVADSYAARSGSGTRNVGVIGVAVFDEKYSERHHYGGYESGRRHAADPFPGEGSGSRFARPPGG